MRYNIWFRAFFKDMFFHVEDIISGGPGEVPVGKSVSRAVASMYSWGGGGGGGGWGVGQKFPNDEKYFRIYHGILSHEGVCYSENEDTIYKQKYAYFTHRHITEAVR
jgi:hypothetical protein